MRISCDFPDEPNDDGLYVCRRCGFAFHVQCKTNCPVQGRVPKKGLTDEENALIREGAERLGLVDMAKQYARSLLRWGRAGFPQRSNKEVERIYETACGPCDRRTEKYGFSQCTLCGCRVSPNGMAVRNKIKMATETCPEDRHRWDKPCQLCQRDSL